MINVHIKEVRNKITEPLIIPKETYFEEIADLFLTNKTNRTAYIVDQNKKLLGYLTLKKLVKKLLIDMLDSNFYVKNGYENYYSLSKFGTAKTVAELMETDSIGVTDNDKLDLAVKIMYKFEVQELPVINAKNEVIGDLNILEIVLGWKEINKWEF